MSKAFELIIVILIAFVALVMIFAPTPKPLTADQKARAAFWSSAPADATEVPITVKLGYRTLNSGVHHLGEAIWHAAQTYRQAQTLHVTVVLGHELREDRYGQPLTQDLPMGTFTLTDATLQDIRRYVSETAYAYAPAQEIGYGLAIRSWPLGQSLQ